ncbi:MAG: lysophospholipid acyltransferase family protein [Verrucomicrobia bacterium]|nr:lysophospholipid acyltransferase family protein [Verrucomicrobiota bacterium]
MTRETKARMLAGLGACLVRLWIFTLRYRIVDRAGVLETPPEKPLLWAFWHNKLFVMPRLFERYFPGRLGAALASASKDGEIISAFLERFGIRAIRGSSSRGGGRALIEMKRAIEAGYIMAITPDGPRGPRYSISPGVIKLAQITGGLILPIHVTYSSYWQLKTWDGFMIPKPFSRIHITFDVLHEVPATVVAETFENARIHLEQMMRPQHGQ